MHGLSVDLKCKIKGSGLTWIRRMEMIRLDNEKIWPCNNEIDNGTDNSHNGMYDGK